MTKTTKVALISLLCAISISLTHCARNNTRNNSNLRPEFTPITASTPNATVINYNFTLPENQNNVTYTIEPGSEFSIMMKGNPTTGYSWLLTFPGNKTEIMNVSNLSNATSPSANATLSNHTIVIPLNLNEHGSATYVPSSTAPGIVGAGGTYIFRFKAQGDHGTLHEGVITLAYKRPWENAPYRTVNVNIKFK